MLNTWFIYLFILLLYLYIMYDIDTVDEINIQAGYTVGDTDCLYDQYIH